MALWGCGEKGVHANWGIESLLSPTVICDWWGPHLCITLALAASCHMPVLWGNSLNDPSFALSAVPNP